MKYPPPKYRTTTEYEAEALLLDMRYDPEDHTHTANQNAPGPVSIYDPETMELLSTSEDDSWFVVIKSRRRLVHIGEIGTPDNEYRGKEPRPCD